MKDETRTMMSRRALRFTMLSSLIFVPQRSSLEGAPHLHGLENEPDARREQQQQEESPRGQGPQGLRHSARLSQGKAIAGVKREQQSQVEEENLQAGEPIRHRAATSSHPVGWSKNRPAEVLSE